MGMNIRWGKEGGLEGRRGAMAKGYLGGCAAARIEPMWLALDFLSVSGDPLAYLDSLSYL
jgi:hypothetical protein